jgi:chromosome segregation ATPase
LVVAGCGFAVGCGEEQSRAPAAPPTIDRAGLETQRAELAQEQTRVLNDIEAFEVALDALRLEAEQAGRRLDEVGTDEAHAAKARADRKLQQAEAVYTKLQEAAGLLDDAIQQLDRQIDAASARPSH